MFPCGVISSKNNLIELTYHSNDIFKDKFSHCYLQLGLLCEKYFPECSNNIYLSYGSFLRKIINNDHQLNVENIAKRHISAIQRFAPNENFDIAGFMQKCIDATDKDILDLETSKKNIADIYNQNFLRFRVGAMFFKPRNNPAPEVYFRVASKGFNWFDIIWQFVYEHRNQLSNVTITRDNLADDTAGYYYIGGNKMDKFPVDEFITLDGNPEIDENYVSLPKEYFGKYFCEERTKFV